jgi:hypothetical protein
VAKRLTAGDIETLQASWAWKIARPLYKVEREIQRWQRKRRKSETPVADELEEDGLPEDLAPQLPVAPPPPQPASAADPAPDFSALEAAYRASPLAAQPDTFVLYRILGNDLEPRHVKGQTRRSLGLILGHEPDFEDCEKRWVLNRIVDRDEENRIIDLLERSGQSYLRIPFDMEAYGRTGWETDGFPEEGFFLSDAFQKLKEPAQLRAEVHARSRKNLYVMNNNGGRNAALEDGRARAKWVLPFDGNCFLTRSAWTELRAAVTAQPYLRYFTVPMLRVARNEDLLRDHVGHPPVDEPQILFRCDAAETFHESYPYGKRPKVELLHRLGVPGPWSGWWSDPWDLPEPAPSPEAGHFAVAGWVGRLESGRPELEMGGNGASQRALFRSKAIIAALDALDAQAIAARYRPEALTLYDAARIERLGDEPAVPVGLALRHEAEAALLRGPYSVTDKSVVAASGNPHDYLSLARYWWPNPETPDGLPYMKRDGEDVFAAGLPELTAENFDRDRIQSLFDDVLTLALAGTAFRDERFLKHAAHLVRVWFLDPATRMTPHLRFSQVTRGHHGEEGQGSGVIDLAGIAAFLDAVRLLDASGAVDDEDQRAFRNWLRAYLDWLHASPQGRHACRASNNRGTFHDVQTLAIAAYLGDAPEIAVTLRRARERIPHQFAGDGSQPEESVRTRPWHYSHFNLVGWTQLARIAEAVGDDLWNCRARDGRGIERGLAWLLQPLAAEDGARLDTSQDMAPLAPLALTYRTYYGDPGVTAEVDGAPAPAPVNLDPRSGVPRYWKLLR